MSTNDHIEPMVEQIRAKFDPERIVLFGSHARDEARSDSDLDFLIVLRKFTDRREIAVAIRKALSDFPVSKDIVVATPDEIERRGTLVGSILRPALAEGKTLYERHG